MEGKRAVKLEETTQICCLGECHKPSGTVALLSHFVVESRHADETVTFVSQEALRYYNQTTKQKEMLEFALNYLQTDDEVRLVLRGVEVEGETEETWFYEQHRLWTELSSSTQKMAWLVSALLKGLVSQAQIKPNSRLKCIFNGDFMLTMLFSQQLG